MAAKYILDWNEYVDTARQIVAEGCVLLENHEQTLPLKKDTKVSVFGRIQNSYYKSGTGSGGMVNVSEVIGIVDALRQSGEVELNEALAEIYSSWEEVHPFDEGEGWGNEPWCQVEMELEDSVVEQAAKDSDVAIVIIGRTAGEDQDASDTKGSYRLTDIEEDMLQKVNQHFDKMIVLLNVGGLIDMSFVDRYHPDAVMYVWQGGMIGGLGTADVLLGKVSPSGRLVDTIAYAIEDYPSSSCFGDADRNCYEEDIYVGYRYFETFAKEKVRYPFGFGMSYSEFNIDGNHVQFNKNDVIKESTVSVTIDVKNVGEVLAKEVAQVYVEAPQGKLGRPARILVGYWKTEELAVGETATKELSLSIDQFVTYDDLGVTGYQNSNVLEEGTYHIYVGTDVRQAKLVGSFEIEENIEVEHLPEALAPHFAFSRMKAVKDSKGYSCVMEEVPLATVDEEQRRLDNMPQEIAQIAAGAGEVYKLADVVKGHVSVEEFVAQMTDDELTCVIRGEGMGSSRVTPGTAAAFGGVSDSLVERLGIPAVCCSDGPSGMRLDCGVRAFSLPNGTIIGCTFNPELVEGLYSCTGREMISQKVECLLGPGMNIHRNPLNGRNFEYFSEDPYVTGTMALAMVKGLRTYGATGTMKHFAGNNQEFRRHFADAVISQRALRDIYLKGFEMVVRSGVANSIMTSYGPVNGLWTAGNYDLNTTILRDQWGYKGIVMTDWWAAINERGKKQDKENFAAMVRSQNDIYMVCPDGSTNASGDNTMEALLDGRLERAELQKVAINICNFVKETDAMKRMMGEGTEIEIVNRPVDEDDVDMADAEFRILDGDVVIPLDYKKCKAGTSYLLPFDIAKFGTYEITVVGSSKLGELAQMPCTLFYTSIPVLTFTFHGTEGEDMEVTRQMQFFHRFSVMRLSVARNGLDLKEIRFKFLHEGGDLKRFSDID